MGVCLPYTDRLVVGGLFKDIKDRGLNRVDCFPEAAASISHAARAPRLAPAAGLAIVADECMATAIRT